MPGPMAAFMRPGSEPNSRVMASTAFGATRESVAGFVGGGGVGWLREAHRADGQGAEAVDQAGLVLEVLHLQDRGGDRHVNEVSGQSAAGAPTGDWEEDDLALSGWLRSTSLG